MTDTPTPRRTVPAAEKAQEAVDVLERRLAKLRDKAEEYDGQAHAARLEITAVEKRLTYAKANPDLATTTPTGYRDRAAGADEVAT